MCSSNASRVTAQTVAPSQRRVEDGARSYDLTRGDIDEFYQLNEDVCRDQALMRSLKKSLRPSFPALFAEAMVEKLTFELAIGVFRPGQ